MTAVYLGFGLLIGIAGLGVVMVRAARERRHEIGTLRARRDLDRDAETVLPRHVPEGFRRQHADHASTVRAMTASLGSVSTSRTKDWSIFNWSSGRRLR